MAQYDEDRATMRQSQEPIRGGYIKRMDDETPKGGYIKRMDEDTPLSPVFQANHVLDDAIDSLESHLELLFDKIKPVIGPSEADKPSIHGMASQSAECSDIVRILEQKTARIQALSANVILMRARVEL